MQIGQQSPGAGFSRPVSPMQARDGAEGPRNDRLFQKLDRDGDGQLSKAEFGDRPGKGIGWAWGARAKEAMMQNIVTAQMADYLTEQVPSALPGEELVNEVLSRLDADGSGALNSEEIAGTRLAEKIGAAFYDLDGDRSGTLDAAELGAFIRAEVLGLADPVAAVAEEAAEEDVAATDPAAETVAETGAETVAATGTAAAEEAGEVVEAAATDGTAETAATDTGATGDIAPDPAQAMLSAFETALQMIQDGQEARSTYDVVSALYGEAKDIFTG